MLRPGGVFFLRDLVFSFEPHDAESTIEQWLARAAARPEDGWTRAELETHVREEFSTYNWLLEPMLERAGFEIREIKYARLPYLRGVSLRKALKNAAEAVSPVSPAMALSRAYCRYAP